MIDIQENNTKTHLQASDTVVQKQYAADKQDIENFLARKSSDFNFSAMKRLVLSELSYRHSITQKRICGFSRRQIINLIQHPEHYPSQLVRLSRYMMLKSGYYKRLVEYFVNMGIINWTIDTEIKDVKFYNTPAKKIKSNYIRYTAQCNKFKLNERITEILRRLYIEDVCFGFVTETDIDTAIFFIDPQYCEIQKLVSGNVYEYAINRSLLNDKDVESLPDELQEILRQSSEVSLNNMVTIPYKNSLCLKYHYDLPYVYPPFFNLIADILLIDDYKELAKAKTESDAYKLIYFKIPTNSDGQIAMGDNIVIPFVEMAKDIVPETWGVVPSPMDLQLLESKSTINDDKNKVQEAVDSYYGEAGVSKALISSASSGSELKMSMKVDSSDLYRIYRQIEAWMDLQLKLRGFVYPFYQFVFNILDMTIFDIDDVIDRALKLAQISAPNKSTLLAANGINTAKLLGNTYMENEVLSDIFDSWKPLQSTYTQSGANDVTNKGGRPEQSDDTISKGTEIQRQNDSNSTDNRI